MLLPPFPDGSLRTSRSSTLHPAFTVLLSTMVRRTKACACPPWPYGSLHGPRNSTLHPAFTQTFAAALIASHPQPKIRYSLAGQDTRPSPERPGFESRWRKWHQLAPGWMGPPLRLTTSPPLIHLGEVARIKRLPPVPWGLPCPGTPSTLPLEFPVACSIRPVVSR